MLQEVPSVLHTMEPDAVGHYSPHRATKKDHGTRAEDVPRYSTPVPTPSRVDRQEQRGVLSAVFLDLPCHLPVWIPINTAEWSQANELTRKKYRLLNETSNTAHLEDKYRKECEIRNSKECECHFNPSPM